MDKYWKVVWANVKLSARHGAGGARIQKKDGSGSRELTITLDYIKDLWEKQNGKCIWLGIDMSLEDVMVKNSPFAVSVERLDSNLGYIPGNVALASRFANRGRGAYDGDDFEERLNYLINNRER